MSKGKTSTMYMVYAAMIAAIYVVLCYIFQPISFGAIQVRIAESLTILPFFTPAAIPGVTIGCLLSNLLAHGDILDIIFGTFATFIAAIATYKFRHIKYLAQIPPIVSNTIIIPWVLRFAYGESMSIPLMMLTVGVGEVISAGVLGMILLYALNSYKHILFKPFISN